MAKVVQSPRRPSLEKSVNSETCATIDTEMSPSLQCLVPMGALKRLLLKLQWGQPGPLQLELRPRVSPLPFDSTEEEAFLHEEVGSSYLWMPSPVPPLPTQEGLAWGNGTKYHSVAQVSVPSTEKQKT